MRSVSVLRKPFLLLILVVSVYSKNFICPIADCSDVLSSFAQSGVSGTKKFQIHTGVDFNTPEVTPIFASSSGKVIRAGFINGYGISIMIEHDKAIKTFYAYLSKLTVQVGTLVKQGDIIAYSGNSSNSQVPHLHFGVYKNSCYVDPLWYLQMEKK